MSNALTVYAPSSIDEARQIATDLADSGLMPKELNGNPQAVFAILAQGAELNLKPMASLNLIHVIQGRPRLSPQGMVAVCLASPLCEYFHLVEGDANSATWETKRRGAPGPRRSTWSMADAKTADLRTDMWRKYPKQMVQWRAAGFLAREVYPDIVGGLYTTDEAADFDEPRSQVEPRVETRATSRHRTEAAAATVARRTEALRHGTSAPPAAVEDAEVVEAPRGVEALRVALRAVDLTLDEYDTWAAHVAGKISATIDATAAEKMAEWVTRGTNADRVRSKLAEIRDAAQAPKQVKAPKQAKASEPHAPRADELQAALEANGVNADCAADYAIARGIKAATDNGARALWLAIMQPTDDDFAAFMAEWDRAHPEASTTSATEHTPW